MYRDQLVANIVAAYEQSSKEAKDSGRVWYEHAHNVAKSIHPSVAAGAGVLAALSPNITWSENIKGAVAICKVALSGNVVPPVVAGYGLNQAKAWDIARGEYSVSPVERLSTTPGMFKVNRFYANIMGDHHVVTVDRWAARVAQPLWPEGKSVKGRSYLEFEKAYQLAADVVGESPAHLQAICWIHVRGNAE